MRDYYQHINIIGFLSPKLINYNTSIDIIIITIVYGQIIIRFSVYTSIA